MLGQSTHILGVAVSTNVLHPRLTLLNLLLGVNDSPLMTWGEIESTPLRVDGSETPYVDRTPGPAFKVFHVRFQHSDLLGDGLGWWGRGGVTNRLTFIIVGVMTWLWYWLSRSYG